MAATLTTAASTQEKLLRARATSGRLALLSTAEKNLLLRKIAAALEANEKSILAANREDVDTSGLEGAMRDRLLLTPSRVKAMADGVRDVAALPDPIGETLAEWTKANGLRIRKLRVPLGVVGIIYESRPNVTVDTAVLALKTGNAIVLRGGKEAAQSNQRLVEIMSAVPGVPEGSIELLDSSTRQSVHELIKARGLVDVIIPRGGAGLITFVTENSTVPIIETGAGNCHIFVDESADFDMADSIVINAKTQRPSVCNAAEKLLVHERIAAEYVPRIVKKLIDAGVEVRGDGKARTLAAGLPVGPATEQDWYEEYLRLCMAVAVVSNVDDAIAHINRYSTKHSDSIVTLAEANARRFLRGVDSAAVYWNASTRFTDGAEFGFGAEMGISTQKLHCRGPFALAELTSSKYEVIGTGQVR
ncbi:MAG TPA: glutamate-5-semialdehyde dehydrogenase [Pirellulales bacterium]|jgi:glutamate-5-semialdehyde dehydrogenase|nr:glutamate-5-semialdehyde dehydrogenase [Pirellulales bacterium]